MKILRNTSMQGLSIPFGTSKGVKTFFLAPRQQIEIPSEWTSSIAKNLVHRRMIKMTTIPDPVASPQPALPPRKRNKKSN